MLGFIVELLLSWLLLHFLAQTDLRVLGWTPVARSSRQFLVGLLVVAILCILNRLWDGWIAHYRWKVNGQQLQLVAIANSFWWVLKAVLFEEFLFRGALLYILIRKLGWKIAVGISAVAFGCYHWFSYNLWGNPVQMVLVFIITAVAGWVWAYSFAKTQSMALATGMHLGWNIISIAVFSSGTSAKQILIPVKEASFAPLTGIPSLLNFLISSFLVAAICWLVIRAVTDKKLSKIPSTQ